MTKLQKLLAWLLPWLFEWFCDRCNLVERASEAPRCPKCGDLMHRAPPAGDAG
jgi:rubrerythrin